MRKLIIANWKLNPGTEKGAVLLARREDLAGVVIAPPFPYIPAVAKVLKQARLAAQDAFPVSQGAYTGEVSVAQLKSMGVQYVIVGHSERRALGDTDRMVNMKLKAVLGKGLKAVLCIGEPWSVRRRGLTAAKSFVKGQLMKDLKGVRIKKNLIVAYEPVWAIGSGRPDKPNESAVIAEFVKKISGAKILYGGSVTAGNAAQFLGRKEIDGVLVGGASLRPAEFKKIVSSS
ncbi:MAG TPA: triose-phosphate isomerase [Candidatus Paceibacterota bacterium]|nr:triose-phosphate isomerase [Candidatus Paceibacterota bacterium]